MVVPADTKMPSVARALNGALPPVAPHRNHTRTAQMTKSQRNPDDGPLELVEVEIWHEAKKEKRKNGGPETFCGEGFIVRGDRSCHEGQIFIHRM